MRICGAPAKGNFMMATAGTLLSSAVMGAPEFERAFRVDLG
jgi:hypothetical protein